MGKGLYLAGGAVLAIGAAAAAVAQTPPRELPAGDGPRATSAATPDDAVGYAAVLPFDGNGGPTVGIAAEHPNLTKGSFIEVTALDSGRTIAMMVVGPFAGRGVVGLSPQAAEALGVVDHAPVRVRGVTPDPWEQTTLRSGRATGARLDAPPALLVALRKRLPLATEQVAERTKAGPGQPKLQPTKLPHGEAARAKPVPQPEPVTTRPSVAPVKPAMAAQRPAPAAQGRYHVQIAALSSSDRAATLAKSVGGHVEPAGKMYRVLLGPFADPRAAALARDKASRQGYRGAQISRSDP